MVKIITDTTAGISKETASRYGIPVIPQIIVFGEESFYEGIDIDNAGFMDRLKSSPELPKTAAPPPELFVEQFEKFAPTGETILCIHPSAEVSGTVRSALIAAQDFPNTDIRVIDTRTISSPLCTMVELAALWASNGENADTIESRIKDMIPRCKIYFLVSTLEYLAKGGRIGGAAALVGSVLQIKPILTIVDGKVDQFERERTQKRAVARLIELVQEQIAPGEEGYLSLMHAGVPQQVLDLSNILCAKLNLKTAPPILDVPPAIVTHGGPGILGVAFFIQ
jgi:DegV family protein with EDD domain